MSNEIIVGCWSIYQRPRLQQEQRTQRKPAKKKAKYVKPAELVQFEDEYNAHYYDSMPNIPNFARVKTHFRDDSANALTGVICEFLKYKGHFAGRVNTTGIYDAKTGKYRQTNARKGMADISAVINGKPVQIEIKAGRDKPRAEQLKVAEEYEKAGGRYVFVHNFPEWVKIYDDICGSK